MITTPSKAPHYVIFFIPCYFLLGPNIFLSILLSRHPHSTLFPQSATQVSCPKKRGKIICRFSKHVIILNWISREFSQFLSATSHSMRATCPIQLIPTIKLPQQYCWVNSKHLKLFTTQLSSASRCFQLLRSKYSPLINNTAPWSLKDLHNYQSTLVWLQQIRARWTRTYTTTWLSSEHVNARLRLASYENCWIEYEYTHRSH